VIDAIKEFGINAGGMRDARKMNDLIDSVEQRPPIDYLCQVCMMHHFDVVGERWVRRLPHGGANIASPARECCDNCATDEAGCSGYQYAAHGAEPIIVRT